MNICIVARGLKIPVTNYGGTERVIWGLGKELHAIGHSITFIVPQGSHCDFARVLPLNENADLNDQIPEDIDLVHLNYTPQSSLRKPSLITMHGNPPPTEELDINTVFISKNHAARYNADVFVYNGLLWEDYPTPNLDKTRNGYHFLGKAKWSVKNAVGAMEIARLLNEKLSVIGGKKWTSRNFKSGFFHLFNNNIKFHGFLGNEKKQKVMEESKGLIFPVLWHEPFGLAIIESLYSGCAVFGTEYGSLKELITPEIGYTNNSLKKVASAIESFKADPQTCHNYARDNFNSKKMTLAYLDLYKRILNGEQLNRKRPTYNPVLNQVSKIT